jgi:nitroreductase/NAD-dependent dihydropyrimidine dehydrogenase PreA subunit
MIRDFVVREDRCIRCGACVRDCPVCIIEQDKMGKPFVTAGKEDWCIECQHCLAVCPTAAISVFGVDPDRSLPMSPEVIPSLEEMERPVRGRRSVRQYLDKNVDPKLIDRLLAAVANSPTGCNDRKLTFTVIDDKAVLAELRQKVMQRLVETEQAGRIPERGALLREAIGAYIRNGSDVIFRGAPHALIISASPESSCPVEDVDLAVAYFELLANTAGLGTVWCGFLKFAFEIVPELKPLVGLPADHAYYAILFGYPAVHYPRTVQRDLAAKVVKVRKLDEPRH